MSCSYLECNIAGCNILIVGLTNFLTVFYTPVKHNYPEKERK